MEELMVRKDVWDTMVYLYFGNTDNCYKAASTKAYLDLCRTIKFVNSNNQEERAQVRKVVDLMLEEKIKALANHGMVSQESYDAWHKEFCNEIVKQYDKICGNQFCIGQAQKWINMTIKYLYLINNECVKTISDFAHVPLDNYVFDAAKDSLCLTSAPPIPWSKITDYNIYLDYQKELRNAIKADKDVTLATNSPLQWELVYWLEQAKTHNLAL